MRRVMCIVSRLVGVDISSLRTVCNVFFCFYFCLYDNEGVLI